MKIGTTWKAAGIIISLSLVFISLHDVGSVVEITAEDVKPYVIQEGDIEGWVVGDPIYDIKSYINLTSPMAEAYQFLSKVGESWTIDLNIWLADNQDDALTWYTIRCNDDRSIPTAIPYADNASTSSKYSIPLYIAIRGRVVSRALGSVFAEEAVISALAIVCAKVASQQTTHQNTSWHLLGTILTLSIMAVNFNRCEE